MCNKHIVFAKGGVEGIIEPSVAFSRACFFVPQFFCSLVPRKKHLLRLVEIELFVQFSPPFANTFSVVCHIIPKIALEKHQNIICTFATDLIYPNKTNDRKEKSYSRRNILFVIE